MSIGKMKDKLADTLHIIEITYVIGNANVGKVVENQKSNIGNKINIPTSNVSLYETFFIPRQ